MRDKGPIILRAALGAVFLWFGALKLVGRSPVEDMVTTTLRVVPENVAVAGLGLVEVIVGLGLLTGIALRLVLAIFWLQLAGTFLVFVVAPSIAFQNGNPFLLTTEGEFVVKNLVLIAAGIVVGGEARRLRAPKLVAPSASRRDG